MPAPLYHRYLRVKVAQMMGWTLAEVDRLGLQDWLDTLACLGAQADLSAFGQG